MVLRDRRMIGTGLVHRLGVRGAVVRTELSPLIPIAALGLSASVGAATATVQTPITASSTSASDGEVNTSGELPITASSSSASAGTATATVQTPVTTTGTSSSAGTATATVGTPVTASGESASAGTATGTVTDAASTVVLDGPLVKLDGVNPVMVNTDTPSSPIEFKVGPGQMVKISGGPATWAALMESIEEDASFTTRAGLWTAPSAQGPWTFQGAVINPGEVWEQDEVAPHGLLVNAAGTGFHLLYHGGHNTGPREMGLATNDDANLNAWTKDAGNPVLEAGTSGQWDDLQASDPSAVRLDDNSIVGFYKGRGDATAVHAIGRFTAASDWSSITKDAGNPVISPSGVSSDWNETSVHSLAVIRDPRGRMHGWACGEKPGAVTGGLGYYYSDDDGETWTQGSSNPVADRTFSGGDTSRYDYSSIGDTASAVIDGDVVVILVGCSNFSGSYTPDPMRGKMVAIHPLDSDDPAIPAKFIGPDTTATRSGMPCSAADLKPLNAWAICGRFRAFSAGVYQHLFTIGTDAGVANSFQHDLFVRLDASSGLLDCWYRTPTGFDNFTSASRMDDATIYDFLWVRNSAADFELWVREPGGSWTRDDLGTTDLGTATVTDYPMIGNYSASAPDGGDSNPARCSIQELFVLDGAITTTQAAALLDSGTAPGGGVSILVDMMGGTGIDSEQGDIHTVDMTPTSAIALS